MKAPERDLEKEKLGIVNLNINCPPKPRMPMGGRLLFSMKGERWTPLPKPGPKLNEPLHPRRNVNPRTQNRGENLAVLMERVEDLKRTLDERERVRTQARKAQFQSVIRNVVQRPPQQRNVQQQHQHTNHMLTNHYTLQSSNPQSTHPPNFRRPVHQPIILTPPQQQGYNPVPFPIPNFDNAAYQRYIIQMRESMNQRLLMQQSMFQQFGVNQPSPVPHPLYNVSNVHQHFPPPQQTINTNRVHQNLYQVNRNQTNQR